MKEKLPNSEYYVEVNSKGEIDLYIMKNEEYIHILYLYTLHELVQIWNYTDEQIIRYIPTRKVIDGMMAGFHKWNRLN